MPPSSPRLWPLLAAAMLLGCGPGERGEAVADKPLKRSPSTLTANGARTCRASADAAVCWGSNVQGALRPDAPTGLRVPLAAPFEGRVRQLLPLEAATCALLEGGRVRCVGIHPRSILDTEGLEDVTQLAGGRGYACAVHASGAVSCWGVGAPGSNRRHERFAIEGLDDAVQLVAGGSFLCALKRDGTVACWGDNRHGQLGDGGDRAHDTPGPVAYREGDAVELAAGQFHACLRTAGGEVLCWGRDDMGQVDGQDAPQRLEPTRVPELARASAIAAGGNTTCAATSEGVVCWGNGTCGQRGVTPERGCSERRPPGDERAPRVALEGRVDELAMGAVHVCARRGDEVLCWGGDESGQLGRGAAPGMTRDGTCHTRAGLCASEEPRPVAATLADPRRAPRGDGIPWEPPSSFAQAPRPSAADVTFEVLDAEGHDPAWLAEVLTITMRMPTLSCYRRLGPEPAPRALVLAIQEQGAEIPDLTVEDPPEAAAETFGRCVRAAFARGYYSVAGEGRFRVRARFTPDGWDGTM